jgi:group I intron endonuclease
MGFIYKITNTINNKVYIGQTIQTLKERFRKHKQTTKANKNMAIKKAFNKYGVENFKFECVEECDNSLLNEKERFYIIEYNSKVPNGYNMRDGGEIDYKPLSLSHSKSVYQYTK